MIDLRVMPFKKKIKQLTIKLSRAQQEIKARDEKIIELEGKLKPRARRRRKRK